MIIRILFLILILFPSIISGQTTCSGIPDTVCVNSVITAGSACPFNTLYWNFNGGDIEEVPEVFDRGTLPFMNSPVRITVAIDNGLYFAFWTNYITGNITRCEFGNSLRNIPITYNLGDFGGQLTSLNEGIQLIKENGNWYAFLVGSANKLFRIDFGTSLDNPAPVLVDFGSIGNMNLPHGLYMFIENGIWIGLVANAHSNSFTRIVFPDSLTGVPVATNSGIVPGVDYPTSIYPILENDSCYAIVTSRSSNEIFRFNFGDSYMNNMMIVNNLGDIGALNEPFDVAVIRDCDGVFGLVTSRYHMTKVNMPGGVGGLYDGDTLFATGLNRPEGISNAIRQNDSLYFLLANAGNRLTVLAFPTSQGTYPNYFGNNPFNITFSNIGTMPVSLFLNEGEYNQIIECVDVEVIPEPLAPSLQFINDTVFATPSTGIIWFFNGQVIPNYHQDYLVPAMPGQYYAVINNGYCSSSSSIIIDISGIQNDPSSKFSCKGYFAENMLIVEMQCQTAMDAQVELFDITGKKLLTSNRISGNRLSIAANNISKGVYIISVHTLTGSSKCKIVKWM